MSSKHTVQAAAIASIAFIMWKLWRTQRRISSRMHAHAFRLLSSAHRHLILHMDINKTIVMADTVQGKEMQGVINDILAECSWGNVHSLAQSDGISSIANYQFNKSFIINNTIWKPVEPYTITPVRPQSPQDLLSFMEHVKIQHPYPDGKTDQAIKHTRRSYTLRFAELFDGKRNALSQSYLDVYDRMLTKMQTGENGKPVFIVPAFWNCIHDLVQAKRSFSIVFRTFGTDIEDVMHAFNAFCGEHGYDGSKKDVPDLRLQASHIGAINCDTQNGKSLIVGVKGRNPMDHTKEIKQMKLDEFCKLDRMKWYQEQQNAAGGDNDEEAHKVEIICNEHHVYDYIKAESLKQKTMMFSDDYCWWSLHGEHSDGGKMFILNDADSDDILQIFFDDNLEFERAGIVDTRDLAVNDGKTCISDSKWNELKGMHLVKTEPLEVILNDSYFTEHIVKCEEKFTRNAGKTV